MVGELAGELASKWREEKMKNIRITNFGTKESVVVLLIAFFLIAAALPGAGAGAQADDDQSFKILTFNIRYNNPADGKNAWPNRKDMVAGLILFYDADIAGLQEALADQVADLEQRLPDYGWFGVGRDDGKRAGEYSPVFYKKERYELLEHDTFWLSESPDIPGSKSWDAALPRIATWGKLRDKQSGEILFIFNTHFDHLGEEARRWSAGLLLSKTKEIAGEQPVVLTGDFNCFPGSAPNRVITEGGFSDAKEISRIAHLGPSWTFHGFTGKGFINNRIDYIFVKGGLAVERHGILADHVDGRYPSDHLPVLAQISYAQ